MKNKIIKFSGYNDLIDPIVIGQIIKFFVQKILLEDINTIA